MGDFNAQIGAKKHKEEFSVGNFGYGKRSKNGQKLVDFLLEHNMYILNTNFKNKQQHKWTWISPGGEYKNEIDYIISNNPRAFIDTSVIKNLNFNTNHRMVRSKLSLHPPKISRKNFHKSKKETPNVHSKHTFDEINRLLEEGTQEIKEVYTKFEESLSKCKNKPTTNEYDISRDLLELINKRKNLSHSKINNKEKYKQITELSKRINKEIKSHRKKKRFQIIEKTILKTGGIKKALKELKQGSEWMGKMKKSGKIVTKRKDIIQLATDFYQSLYKSNNQEELNNTKVKSEEEPSILNEEVKKSILSQEMDKTPGPDKIKNEILRGTIDEVCPLLTKIFNEILRTGSIPSQWQEAHIILIHKKGDKEDIANYRPISLITNIYKIYSKIILNRITRTLDENQPIEQAGFRKNFSTIDHIHTIKQIIEKYSEYGKTLYMAFIDYAKAFDSISHMAIWKSLKEQGVSQTYITNINNIYANSKARVRLETIGKDFPVRRGVRQGDPLSPKLFTAVLENIFRKLNWDDVGLNINGKKLNHLRFADDLVLLEENPAILEQMIQDLSRVSKDVGLEMNATKTKLMTNALEVDIQVNDKRLEFVNEYIYLGQTITFKDQTTKEINTRIAQGWKKYWSLKEIFKGKDYNLNIKRKTFNTCILPCLTYGCETWALNKIHRNKLQNCQRSMERSILSIRKIDKINCNIIREKTKLTDILIKIDQQKWRWAGHMIRDKKEKWSKLVTVWYPRDEKRNRGRPAMRWEDEIKLTAGPFWKRAAQDREYWKELEEAFAKRHSEIRDII